MISRNLSIVLMCFFIAGAFAACKSTAPKVEKVEAEKPDVEPGETVKLVGDNFGEDLSKLEVKVGDQEAEVTKAEDESLEVKLPREVPAGSHKLVVKNKETKEESQPLEVKVIEPSPEIIGTDPDPVRRGSVLQVEGEHFNPSVAGMEATLGNGKVPVGMISPVSLEVRVPEELEAGTYDLVLTDLKTGKSSSPREIQVSQLVEVPSGTELHLRTKGAIGSEASQPGDEVSMVLSAPLVSNGRIVAPAGSSVLGRVTFVEQPGKVKGRAAIGFTVERISLGNNESVAVQTNDFNSRAPSGKKDDAKKIAITTGIGTIVGAIAGGKKGAAIGAATGAAAGTTIVLVTKGDHVLIPADSEVDFVLQKPLEVEIRRPLPAVAQMKNQD